MSATEGHQKLMDERNFDPRFIGMLQRIMGETWMSPGGARHTKVVWASSEEFLATLGLVPGQRVLDLACGTGGAAFLMARCYGVHVHGVDISTNVLQVAQNYLAVQEKKVQDLVHFEAADMTTMQLEDEGFDVIFSRDSFIYIYDKESFSKKMLGWLRPGGKLFFTDYCRGTNKEPCQALDDLIKLRTWKLNRTVKEYGEALREAGFKDVKAQDISDKLLQTQTEELNSLTSMRECFIQDFSEEGYNEAVSKWKNMVATNKAGVFAWGLFQATK